MKRLLYVALILSLLLGVFSVPVYAKKDKVDVCHVKGNGDVILIQVAEKAVDAHIAHGDGIPGSPVPGMDGYVFGDDCTPVEEPSESPLTATNVGCVEPGTFDAWWEFTLTNTATEAVTFNVEATFDDGTVLADGPIEFDPAYSFTLQPDADLNTVAIFSTDGTLWLTVTRPDCGPLPPTP